MQLLLLTERTGEPAEVAPSLAFLDHELTSARLTRDFDPASHRGVELVLIDATANLGAAATACRHVAARAEGLPIVVVVADAALTALKASWGFDDWLLPGAQPGEIETRMRLARERAATEQPSREASVGDLSIDEDTYVVRLRGRPLDLTFREFELLKYLAANPGRVFTRGQLLQEVWGYDYFGGTRTVDVHIRRLRAKLGAEYEQLIGTVRGVGYKLDPQGASSSGRPDERGGPPA